VNIVCPVCENKLKKITNTYKCDNNHCFDIAKQGYINLNLRKSSDTGDESNMINARSAFLNKDYYDFMRKKVDSYINEDDNLLDLACGEGYYTAFFKAKNKIGIDLSKQGLKIASKKDNTTTYILSSIFRAPIKDESMDKVITIFAPIAKQEIVRVLKKDGLFILVKPDINHLLELKKAVYDNPYLNEVEDIEIEGLKLIDEVHIENKAILDNVDLNNLFMMTPYYHKTSVNDMNKLKNIDNLEACFSFIIDVYQKY